MSTEKCLIKGHPATEPAKGGEGEKNVRYFSLHLYLPGSSSPLVLTTAACCSESAAEQILEELTQGLKGSQDISRFSVNLGQQHAADSNTDLSQWPPQQSQQVYPGIDRFVPVACYLREGAVDAELTHAAQILNSAVNLSCELLLVEFESSTEPEQILGSIKLVTGNSPQEKIAGLTGQLREKYKAVFSLASELISTEPELVISRLGEGSRDLIEDWMAEKNMSLREYLEQHALGNNGFVYAKGVDLNLDENHSVIPDIACMILHHTVHARWDKAHENRLGCGYAENPQKDLFWEAISLMLKTSEDAFHSYLLKSARGIQGSVGGGSGGLYHRTEVEVSPNDADEKAIRPVLSPAEQAALTEEIRIQNQTVGIVQRVLAEVINPIFTGRNIELLIAADNNLRQQKVCPVLKRVDPIGLANSRVITLPGDADYDAGYFNTKDAYLPQVKLLYALLARLYQVYSQTKT